MIEIDGQPPGQTRIRSSAASDVYTRQSPTGGSSAVEAGGIPGVAVECADIGKNTDGEGSLLGRH